LLSAQTTAITNVTVIDMTGAPPRAGQTVVIEGNRIASVGTAAAPRMARVIDGSGKFLIPGLWDMHVHLTVPGGEAMLSLYVANGVTGVRDMNDSLPQVRAWQPRIASGSLMGPRIVASGAYLEGEVRAIPHLLVKTPEQGRAGVDSLIRLGVDFIKVHNRLSRASYFAIAEAARQRGMVFAGHVPDSVTVVEASAAGQRSLEHLFGFPSICSDAERVALAPKHPIQRFLGTCADRDPTADFKQVAANGAWAVPTLVINYPVALLPDTILGSDSTLKYRSPGLRRLEKLMMSMPTNVTADAGVVGRQIFLKRVALVGAMHRAGIPLMTGSDAPGKNALAGFSLHDELAFFVQGGLSPMEALRSATYEPARYLNALDSLGTIAPGKIADLLLLDADPLKDIINTRRIAAVVWNGRVMDAADRKRVLEDAEQAARQDR
jgi:hypothetical protein